jgi:predicted nucleic-acid-binding Zn-ribbon protein
MPKPNCPKCGAAWHEVDYIQRVTEYCSVVLDEDTGEIYMGDVLETDNCDFVKIHCNVCGKDWSKEEFEKALKEKDGGK